MNEDDECDQSEPEEENVNRNDSEAQRKFLVDYCKRGSTKCKRCRRKIPKDELRIGKSAPFKTKTITQYFHVQCAFDSFKRARTSSNVITCMDDISGFELIHDEDRIKILHLMDETNAKRTVAQQKPKEKPKRAMSPQEPSKSRKVKLKNSNLPAIKIMYTNADQLTTSKMTELKNTIERKQPLIVAICEIKPKIACERSQKDYEIPNYTIHPVNLDNDNGRGLAIYVHKSLEKSAIQLTTTNDFNEVCLVEIRLRGGDMLLFGCCYRSPTTTELSGENNDKLNRLLKCISLKKYSHICIVGDFNYKAINWSSWTSTLSDDSTEARFIETARDCYFHQHVESPTRRRGTDEPSLLDLVFTNETMQVSEITHNPPLGKSDHDVLTFDFQCYVDYTKQKASFCYDKGKYSEMRESLANSGWVNEFINLAEKADTTTEQLWTSLKTKLSQLRKEFVPLTFPSSKPTWIDKGSIPIDKKTREAIHDKEKTHRLWISDKKKGLVETARSSYTRSRNKVKTLLRKARRRFERDIAHKAKTNPKAFWGHTRRSLKTKAGIAPLLSDPKDKESMKFDDLEKASILLGQFSSVFTREKPGDIPRLERRTNSKLCSLDLTTEMVLKELQGININKSCRPDGIHPRLLLELAEIIATPVTMLFTATLQNGTLPEDWKKATITPIYKKGSRHLAENYRPISLTEALCKIMEKFLRDEIVGHLLKEKLLSPKQYGFITGRSTTTQLLYYLDECIKTISNSGVVDSVYLDFSKAFDTVPHRRLLGKLEAYGIEETILNWIQAFLEGRTQEVMVNGCRSKSESVISGVPQGTVLGPILFVIYINDLLDHVTSHGLMFADDTKIFRRIASYNDAKELQADIAKLEEWSDTWQLRFNYDKCHILTLGKFDNIHHAQRYVMSGNELEHVFDEKDLGVTIDGELSFEEHIARKVRIANGIVGQIRRSFAYLDCETFRRIYCAFVRPHLEYGQSAWAPHRVKDINALENVQIRATKLVDGLGKLDYAERLKRLNLPSLAFRRQRGDMIEIYKHFHTYDRSTLSPSFIPRNRPSRKHKFQLLSRRAKDGTRGLQYNSFYYRCQRTWNNLPSDVVGAEDVNAFKNALDSHWEEHPMMHDPTYREPTEDAEESDED